MSCSVPKQHGTVQYGTLRYATEGNGTVWNITERYGTVRIVPFLKVKLMLPVAVVLNGEDKNREGEGGVGVVVGNDYSDSSLLTTLYY